jgi:hypothetical protein
VVASRPQRATALGRLENPMRGRVHAFDVAAPAIPAVEVSSLVLRGVKAGADITEAVTGGEIERTIEGASTVTLTLYDPDRALLRGRLLNRPGPIDMKLDRFWFRHVRTSKQGDELTLTFEDREVAWLRGYTKPKRAFRDKITRAQFVKGFLDEVTEGKIPFFIPELNVRQPIDGNAGGPGTTVRPIGTQRDRPAQVETDRAVGLSKRDRLSGKGPLTPYKLHNAERALNVAASLGASERATLALLTACIIEAPDFANPTGGDASSSGILQLLSSTAAGLNVDARDIEAVVKLFLTRGFWGKGGAISLAKNTSLTVGNVAQNTQGSAHPERYDEVLPQAKAILAAYGGVSGGAAPGSTRTFERTVVKRYGYTRGTVKKRESSWAAAQRLAEEVNWAAFMVEGRFYFVSEEDLYRQRPRMVLNESTPGVDVIDFDFDTNQRVNEATVTCRADLWTADPGTVVQIEKSGPADGRWLVASMRRSIWDAAAEIALRKPLEEEPEPAPETAKDRLTVGVPDRRSGGGTGRGIRRGLGAKQIVEDAFRVASTFDNNIYVASAYRPGDPLDHGSNDKDKAARDIAYRGIDALVGPPHPALNKACVALGEAFGRSGYGNGTSGPFQQADSFSWHGFRVQIIWQTPQWGGHMGHIHIGAKQL